MRAAWARAIRTASGASEFLPRPTPMPTAKLFTNPRNAARFSVGPETSRNGKTVRGRS